MASHRTRPTPAPTGAAAVSTVGTFDELVTVVAGVASSMEAFGDRQGVLHAADRRCWQLAQADPALARRLRRVVEPPDPSATPEQRVAWRLGRNFRVAEQVAADYAKEQAGR